MEYVEARVCADHRKEIGEKLHENELRAERLETKLDTIISTNRLIAGSVIGGVVTIIITLILRGI